MRAALLAVWFNAAPRVESRKFRAGLALIFRIYQIKNISTYGNLIIIL